MSGRVPFPVLTETEHLPYVPAALEGTDDEFCLCPRIDREMVAAVCRHGYMPMATRVGETDILLIKCHRERVVLEFPDLRVSRSTRRRARGLAFSVDRAFFQCLDGIAQHHPDNNWIIPPLAATFVSLHERPLEGVSFHSAEIWDEDDLVAGEIGYVCGAVYTSVSGFYRKSGAGSVQLACLGRHLEKRGFAFWDLGMEVEYKRTLGARLLPRREFLRAYSATASADLAFKGSPPGMRPAADVLSFHQP